MWPGVTCGMSIYSKASDPIFSFLSVKGQHQNSEKKLICKPASIFLKENLKTKKKTRCQTLQMDFQREDEGEGRWEGGRKGREEGGGSC